MCSAIGDHQNELTYKQDRLAVEARRTQALFDITLACNKAQSHAELSTRFFYAGFKDLTGAGSLLSAIWYMLPLDGVATKEYRDRFELRFCWRRQSANERIHCSDADSDGLLACLQRRLKMLTTSYTIELIESPVGFINTMRIVFQKANMLRLVGDGRCTVISKPDNWNAVLDEVTKPYMGKAYTPEHIAFQDDLDIILFLLLSENRIILDRASMGDVCAYHRAKMKLLTSDFDRSSVCKLISSYPAHIQQRYNFAITHRSEGMTHIEAMRRILLD